VKRSWKPGASLKRSLGMTGLLDAQMVMKTIPKACGLEAATRALDAFALLDARQNFLSRPTTTASIRQLSE
jgi:hypothetical protein